MGGRRGEFGVQGGTDVPHTYVKLDLKVADFAEAAEGERAGWRAAELLGAGLAESLLTLQFYSEVSVPRLTLQLTLDQEKKNKKHTHGVLCWTHTNTLLSHTLLLKHAFSHMPPSRFAAWSCSTSGNMCNTNIFLWQLHTTCCTYCICTYTHTHTHSLYITWWRVADLQLDYHLKGRLHGGPAPVEMHHTGQHLVFDLLEAAWFWYGAQNRYRASTQKQVSMSTLHEDDML